MAATQAGSDAEVMDPRLRCFFQDGADLSWGGNDTGTMISHLDKANYRLLFFYDLNLDLITDFSYYNP